MERLDLMDHASLVAAFSTLGTTKSKSAWRKGYMAGRRGVPEDECPHPIATERGSVGVLAEAWLEGHLEGEWERAGTLVENLRARGRR